MKSNKKTILLISYYFPPETNGGASRAFANYHYLTKLGYRVIVLTNDRASSFDCVDNVYRLKCWRNGGIIGLIKRILGYGLTKLGFYYGEDLYWRDGIVSIIKKWKENIDFVYASYPGVDALITGIYAANLLKAKLVTEFRDGFYFEPHIHMNFIQQQGANKLERKVVSGSEKIICATESITEYFKDKYQKGNVFTIYNGYNKQDFNAYMPERGKIDAPASFIHLGRLGGSRQRNVSPLIDALKTLYKNGRINKHNFNLMFLGELTTEELRSLSDLFASGLIKHRPSVTKEQAFRIVNGYKYLLFYGVPGHNSVVSCKLLEYLQLGKPVLGICKGNEAAEIIKDTGVGEVVDFKKDEIENLFIKAIKGTVNYSPNNNQIQFFDREYQVSKLSEILEE